MTKSKSGEAAVGDAFPKKEGPWFNADTIGKAITNRYVAWLDLMGSKNIMGRSLSNAANYVGKIHICVLEAAQSQAVEVYPVIDGCYVLAEKRDMLESTLKAAMVRLAGVFVHEPKPSRRFLVRGGIAAGRIVTGSEIAKCNETLKNSPKYSTCLALGTAIGQAYSAEAKAPPFGFWVDITARAFRAEKSHPFAVTYWRWWSETDGGDKRRREILGNALMEYFVWAEKNHRSLEYDPARLSEHREAAREYFRVDGAGDDE
jgi:hypothetical protein